jgi:uncharacterized protein (TIGR00369 family)
MRNTENRFEPQDPDFERKIRDSFARQGLMKHLGAEISALRPGYCEIRATFHAELSQQNGYFHAGVSGAIADSACGYAAFSLAPRDSSVLTVEYKMNLLAPALGKTLIARGSIIRSGKTLKICRGDIFIVNDGAEQLCATTLATIMVLTGKPEHSPS